jgi:glycosyltransferase involved in cell wall biosynthesis
MRRAPMTHALVFSNHGLRHSGGIERYLLTLVDALHERGLRPTVVAHRFDRAIPEYGWVDPVLIRTWGLGGALRDLWFDRCLRSLKAKHGWYPLVALSQTAASDIAICGGTHPGFLEAMGRPARWKDRLAIGLERRHFGNAKVVVAHSRLMAAQLQRFYGIGAEKVQVLYPPVDTQRFSQVPTGQRRALRERLGLPADRAVFLLASTGHARKGLDLLVAALGHSPLPVLLAVAGRPAGVEAPNLRYLGYRTDMEDVYRAVDCTVMASRFEPFGLVGVESVLCGTPLIGAAGMGCMEVIAEPAALPFEVDTPGSLQAAIDGALQRWRSGTLAVDDPRAALRYDPSAGTHLDALLACVDRVRRSVPTPAP